MAFDKQYHFVSRLYLWDQDKVAGTVLTQLADEFTHRSQPETALRIVIDNARASSSHGSKNAAALRQPFFNAYPDLKPAVSCLFRLHFMRIIHGIDARPQFLQLFGRTELNQLRDSLLRDDGALAILSTHAVNFLYLYERSFGSDSGLPLERFLEVGRQRYDLSDRTHLQLFIYLYTHCIIGDSLFYYRPVPAANLPVYRTMIKELESVIDERFMDINMDNKCEFLVCASIVGYDSYLRQRIMEEADQSVSTEGVFLVDRHNNNPQADNVSLDKSEHRNVLYLMANRPFTPLG